MFLEPRGLVGATDDRLHVLGELPRARARAPAASNPGAVAARMAEAGEDDVMTLVYTSGTTGPPKGAMLTNKNAAFCIDVIVNCKDRVPGGPPDPRDLIVTYLPLCHVAERIFSTWTFVSTGAVLNFAESIDVVNDNLREVQPTIFFAVPAHLGEAPRDRADQGQRRELVEEAVPPLRPPARQAGSAGRRWPTAASTPSASRVLYAIGWVLVFRAMRERLGLRRVRYAGSGAAPIAPEVLEFFIGIGVPVYELYGMTENTAVATANFVGRMKLGTVGEPYPGIGFRLDPVTGEIQVKHDGVFAGYWNKPDKTAETFTDDGWLMTGDVGEWVDGTHVRIVDRIKHIIITSGGKNISPSEIENSLKTSPYVREAMVIGDGRKFLTAIIGIELETVGDWALRQGIPYTTYRDLSEKPEVIELIKASSTRRTSGSPGSSRSASSA